jgi:zinc transporter 9
MMIPTPYDLAALTLIISLIAGIIPLQRKFTENFINLQRTTGIASRILIASALLVVIPEGFHIAGEEVGVGIITGGAVLAGFLFMLILEGTGIGHAVHEEHHDHTHSHGHEHIHHPENPILAIIGLTIHAATDGLVIGAAASSASNEVTMLVLIAVLSHKFPTSFSVGAFSLHERNDRKLAFRDVLIFSLATPLMIIIAFTMMQDIEVFILGLMMLFSGGTFLYVATVDVLPDVHNPETGRSALVNVLLGAAIMCGIILAVGDIGLH